MLLYNAYIPSVDPLFVTVIRYMLQCIRADISTDKCRQMMQIVSHITVAKSGVALLDLMCLAVDTGVSLIHGTPVQLYKINHKTVYKIPVFSVAVFSLSIRTIRAFYTPALSQIMVRFFLKKMKKK